MILIDRVLFAPISAAVWAARQVHKAAEQAREAEPGRIAEELSQLYMMLETGRIMPQEFDVREKALLDELDRLAGQEDESPVQSAGPDSTHAQISHAQSNGP